MEQKQRVIVYIDGFNFYFGLKSNAKWKKYYWLDIVKLFEMFMRPNQELVAVKYFSAKPDDTVHIIYVVNLYHGFRFYCFSRPFTR